MNQIPLPDSGFQPRQTPAQMANILASRSIEADVLQKLPVQLKTLSEEESAKLLSQDQLDSLEWLARDLERWLKMVVVYHKDFVKCEICNQTVEKTVDNDDWHSEGCRAGVLSGLARRLYNIRIHGTKM